MINREKLAGCNKLLIALLDKIELETLEPLGCQMTLTSGYRDVQYNASVGGSPNSLHTKGLAADFVASGYHVFKLEGDIMKTCKLNPKLRTFTYKDQGQFVHVGINESGEIIELGVSC
jgi:uncharacterized protein YcbK (DUF882 family)